MKKYITISNGSYYEFEFEDMVAMNEHTIRLDKVKCSLEYKIDLYKAGIVTCFSSLGSLYIDMDKAKYVGFDFRK